ncbi:MAG: DUF3467 domain-containing protein [Gemmatimonadota bacterium]|jgi:hypothetical protein|nr:hypothetical protein [Gemmatimonadota bacterium]MDP6461094.1 DUF3467 domain-containing protein [Gemmatimonadota bacterium]MDP6529308.1 DUF3467 domain-containing protein [Gemmatimonadota bacterium]MDP6802193.1 DUF3467 domain-containing protein [Gemmatimonadota bacterium]MDP7031523.1 DUF3467 domain-containing protein [Gemmatimonadota bacterium]
MNQPKPPPGPGQVQIHLPDEVAQGQYSNLVFVTFSPSEFILDFARVLPGARKGQVYSRIITTPQHAKALRDLLVRNVDAFEDKHGAIPTQGQNADPSQIGFAPTSPEGDAGA